MEVLGAFGFLGIILLVLFLIVLGILLPLFVWRINVWTKRTCTELQHMNSLLNTMAGTNDRTGQMLQKLVGDLESYTRA